MQKSGIESSLGRLITGVWRTEDSVAFSHLPNGRLDTGYHFILSGGTLKSYPSYRWIFENTHTGSTPAALSVANFTVYPNPVRDILTIQLETAHGGNYTFTVTDITGGQVRTAEAVNLSEGKEELPVNMDGLPTGIYFLTCGNKTVKIIKE